MFAAALSAVGRFSKLRWTPRFWSIAVGLVCAGFCAASAYMLLELRSDTWDRSVTGELNLLNAFSRDVARNVELYDLSLRSVVDGLATPGFDEVSPQLQDVLLSHRAAVANDLGAMLVLDRTGKVVRASSPAYIGADLSDREYFKALQANPGQGLNISKPFRRRVTGTDKAIALSRALHTPDGAFNGVVVGTLRLSYFHDLFMRSDLGQRGAVNLFLLDGTCLMRVPDEASSIGRSLAGTPNFERFLKSPSGTFSGRSAVDGVQRIYSFTHIADLPLILDVALSQDDVFALWRTKALVISVAMLAMCMLIAILMWLRSKAEAEHRLLADHAIDVVTHLDESLRRTYVSPSSFNMLGFTQDEMLRSGPRQTTHPDDWARLQAWFEDVRAHNTVGNIVFRMRRKDGRYLWVEARCRTVPGERGYLVALRDISERKAAEERASALTAELSRLANSDGLTGLANRRHFDRVLAEAWVTMAESGAPLSLLLLDVDRFKAFNDHYGHQEGDACLCRVAVAVRDAVTRSGALVARYGGEEIAVILPSTDAALAENEAERVRLTVEQLALSHVGQPGGVVTLSVGCATTASADAVPDAPALLAVADSRLYEAKRTGRNRVVGASPRRLIVPTKNEEARLEALAQSEPIFISAKDSLDQICRLASHLLGTPAAFVTLLGRDKVILVGSHCFSTSLSSRLDVFCNDTIQGDEPLVILDAKADLRFADLPLVREGHRFYAGAPLVDPATGHKVGTLCIVDRGPRVKFDRGQRDILSGLAKLVSNNLLGRGSEALAEETNVRSDAA